MLSVTVVIPARNEERSLGEVLRGCRPYADGILVVDGHSADRTAEIARSLGARVIQDRGRGKGDAIRCAAAEIDTDVAVFIDADGSHDPNDIPALLHPIEKDKADHVSGSRLLGGSSELHGTFNECLRLMGSSFITAAINHRFRIRLSESQNGFRAIRMSVLRDLDLREEITTIEQEMIIKTLRKGYRMGEVPAHEYKRRFGESNIRLGRVSFRYAWSAFRYLYLPIRGAVRLREVPAVYEYSYSGHLGRA